ncbi:MAG: phosphopyruvate hydratase [Candidatus Paceibacterota bacterium]
MIKILSIKAREILDSRGNPTIEVECVVDGQVYGKASVPSGASTGVHEAIELRDHDDKRYGGLGVTKAVLNVNIEINNHLKDKSFNQESLDKTLIELDDTENKSRLGANAILGVSLAFARACANKQNVELYEYISLISGTKEVMLPQPMFNILNGGRHADSGLDIQEFMIAPLGFDSFTKKVEVAVEVVSSLKKILIERGYSVSVGDEGGFAPKLSSNEEAFDLIKQAVVGAEYSLDDVRIGIDAAASEFFEEGKYQINIDGIKKDLTSSELISWYEDLFKKHQLISIEDGLSEDDWQGFSELVDVLGDKVKIVGDDLTVTNVDRIKTAFEKKSINSVLIKLNQIGTLTETIKAVSMTKEYGWAPFISHRSGETTDTFIADLSVGLACDFIKAGSPVRGERVCKYNRLMEIENIINSNKL